MLHYTHTHTHTKHYYADVVYNWNIYEIEYFYKYGSKITFQDCLIYNFAFDVITYRSVYSRSTLVPRFVCTAVEMREYIDNYVYYYFLLHKTRASVNVRVLRHRRTDRSQQSIRILNVNAGASSKCYQRKTYDIIHIKSRTIIIYIYIRVNPNRNL